MQKHTLPLLAQPMCQQDLGTCRRDCMEQDAQGKHQQEDQAHQPLVPCGWPPEKCIYADQWRALVFGKQLLQQWEAGNKQT